jgi:hypothetical protein
MKSQNRLLVFLKDKRKKPFFQMAKEFIHLLFLKKEIPYYYFKFCYRKGIVNYTDYLSTGEALIIKQSKNFRKKEFDSLSVNKLFFSLFCEQYGFPTSKLVGYNYNQSFYLNGQVYFVDSLEKLRNYFEVVFTTTGLDSVFIKPMEGAGGNGCMIVRKTNLLDLDSDLFEILISHSYIHQEVIIQHPSVNEIHSSSVNTLRIDTFKDRSGKIHMAGGYMRIGVGNEVVDNVSVGGFFIGVNFDNGTLHAAGQRIMEHGGTELEAHPDSGFVFNGFQIPFFDDVVNLLKQAGLFFPDRYLGWDIAISDKGPIIIEVNVNPALFGTDLVHGGCLKTELFQSILAEAKA